MKFNPRLFYFILFFLVYNNCYCQSQKIKGLINYCIAFCDLSGNPTHGLSLKDTNSTLSVVINWGINQIDTTLIRYDSNGRIDYVSSKFEESRIKYAGQTIKKNSIKYFPSFLGNCLEDTIGYTYFLNKENLIYKIIIECKRAKKQIDLRYIPFSSGKMVELYDGETIVEKYLFLFNEVAEYFQWEIITDKNVFFKFKTDIYSVISQFEIDNKYRQIGIENITFKDAKAKEVEGVFPDKYSVFDASGNVIGTLLISRENHRP